MKVHVIKVEGKTMDLEDLIGNSREHTPVDFESLIGNERKSRKESPLDLGTVRPGKREKRDRRCDNVLLTILDDLRDVRKNIIEGEFAEALGRVDWTIDNMENILAERS